MLIGSNLTMAAPLLTAIANKIFGTVIAKENYHHKAPERGLTVEHHY